jgi:hypothetical protein
MAVDMCRCHLPPSSAGGGHLMQLLAPYPLHSVIGAWLLMAVAAIIGMTANSVSRVIPTCVSSHHAEQLAPSLFPDQHRHLRSGLGWCCGRYLWNNVCHPVRDCPRSIPLPCSDMDQCVRNVPPRLMLVSSTDAIKSQSRGSGIDTSPYRNG